MLYRPRAASCGGRASGALDPPPPFIKEPISSDLAVFLYVFFRKRHAVKLAAHPRDEAICAKVGHVDGTLTCEQERIVQEASERAAEERSYHGNLRTSVIRIPRRVVLAATGLTQK